MVVRLGIVGCGAIAEDMHAPTAAKVDGVRLAALVDSDEMQRTQLAEKFGVQLTAAALKEVSENLDAVILATPPHVRRELVEEAMDLGLHVFCEKPLANSVAESEAIVRAGRAAGRVLAVCHPLRFYPVRRQLPELLKKHDMGRVLRVQAIEGKPYSWPTVTGYTVRKEMSTGGVMINAGIHTLDSILWWFGDPVEIRYEDDSAGGLESNVRLRMILDKGVEFYFRQSRTCLLPHRIVIEAEYGIFSMPTNSIVEYSIEKNGVKRDYVCTDVSRDHTNYWAEQLDDFVECIRTGRDPLVTGEEGIRVIRLIEKCYTMKRARSLPMRALIPGETW